MTEKLPTRKECIHLLKKFGCDENVIDHCLVVEDLAIKMAELAGANKKLVSIAALLHDIGRGSTHGIRHAVEGAKIARKLGLPEKLVLIIERHIGADNLIEENKKRSVHEVAQRFRKLGYKKMAKKILDLHKELSEICGIDLDLI
jgi:putative nucleotidyltransferase with HDIG domain